MATQALTWLITHHAGLAQAGLIAVYATLAWRQRRDAARALATIAAALRTLGS